MVKMLTATPELVGACTISVGASLFLVRRRFEHILDGIEPDSIIKPVVVLPVWELEDRISVESIGRLLTKFDEIDDVYSPDFAAQSTFIFAHTTPQPPILDELVSTYLESASQGKYMHQKAENTADWIGGPYFLQGNQLHQAWRLYSDDLEAFVSTTIPTDSDPYTLDPLKLTSAEGVFSAVAVPSRLYFPVSDDKRLNGMRIAVKDNYHISGTVTTLGSRSYAKCYGIQHTTSTYVKHLIDQGAVIVGKTKLCSFAGAEMPPAQVIDYLAPFNPRGDGYQSPSGSSMGSGVATAGYPWLDFALGTDTTGSTRAPAAANGVWALRTTWESSLMTGIVPSAKPFDTLGLMSRSAGGLLKLLPFGEKHLKSNISTLLYPTDWLPTGNEIQKNLVDDFTASIESLLGVKVTKVSLIERWKETAPEEVRGIALPDYLRKTGWRINMWGGYHNFAEYRELHQKEFGIPPYTSPYQKWKWYDGTTVTPQLREEAETQIDIFKAWVCEHVIKADSSAIMIIPAGDSKPDYRDEGYPNPTGGSTPGGSYNTMFFATMLGLPHLIAPIGQFPYESKITEKTEYLPIAVGLVGAANTDGTLIRLAKHAVEGMRLPSVVEVGSLAFPLHDKTDSGNASMPMLDSVL